MVTMRNVDYAPASSMAPHRHDETHFVVVVRGHYAERIGGVEVEHRQGHMLLYPAQELHSQRFGAETCEVVLFAPEPNLLESLRECGISVERPRYVQSTHIARLGRHLRREVERGDGLGRLAADGLAMELLALFGRHKRQRANTPPSWLRAVRDLVADQWNEPLTLKAVASRAGRHPVHVAREFRRHFGASIGEYGRQLRLRRAEELLCTKRGLSEIALACGFSSHSHFSRLFADAYGLTPSAFRARKVS